MKIQKAAEDYLEAMLMMKEQHGYIRSVDVAGQLGVTKPSVSYATRRPAGERLYHYGPGRAYRPHPGGDGDRPTHLYPAPAFDGIPDALGGDGRDRPADACRIEHDLSEESFEAIRRHAAQWDRPEGGCP